MIAPANNLPAPDQAVYYPGASDGDSIELASTQKKSLKERAKSFFSGFLPKTGNASEESARRMEEQQARAEQRRQQSLGAMAAESGLYSTDRHQAAMDTAKEAQSQMANNLPVVGTLKLLEEAGSGRDSITGREMGTGERLLATAGPATGVATGFAAGIFGRLKNIVPNSGKLVFDAASNTWKSPAGLIYGQGSKQGNRVKHVLEHLAPDPSKSKHSIFAVDRTKVIGLIDEGWAKRSAHVVGDPGVYVVNMGRIIGTAGETHLRIIVRPGTSEIISAYPWVP